MPLGLSLALSLWESLVGGSVPPVADVILWDDGSGILWDDGSQIAWDS